jgi:trigger factor
VEVQYERAPSGLTTITAALPAEDIDEAYQQARKEVRRHVKAPGFRPGRVPPKMVESIVGREQILTFATDALRDRALPKVMAELPHLVTLQDADVSLDGVQAGQGATLQVKVVTAEVKLGEYEGAAIERFRAVVSPEQARESLDGEWRSNAQYEPADHDDVRDGDFVHFSLRIVRDGTLIEDYPADDALRIELGNNGLNPSLDDHLRGLSVGQDAVFEVTYPEDHENEELRGATCEFVVEILGVEQRESFESWIQRLGGDSVEQAVSLAQQSAQVNLAARYHVLARETAVRLLVEGSTIDIPRAEIEAAVMEEIEELEEMLRRRGVPDEELDEVIEHQEERVRERVTYERRREVVLHAVAQTADLKLEQEDLAREIAVLANVNGVEPRLMMRRLEEGGQLGTVARNARSRKAAEHVLDVATVTEVDPPVPGADAEDDHAHDEEQPVALVTADEDDDVAAREPEDEPCP